MTRDIAAIGRGLAVKCTTILDLIKPWLAEQGEEDQAGQWYRKAADAGRRHGRRG